MKFTQYEEAAQLSAVYPKEQAIEYLILGLCSEAGEVADKWKKKIRDGNWDTDEVLEELGDVLWYVTLLAGEFGSSTHEIANMNLEKLADRMNRDKIKGSGDNR